MTIPTKTISTSPAGTRVRHQPPLLLNTTHTHTSNSTTGAGFGDATLRPFSTLNKTVGFLNDTRQQFDLYTSITYGMIMAPSDNLEHVGLSTPSSSTKIAL